MPRQAIPATSSTARKAIRFWIGAFFCGFFLICAGSIAEAASDTDLAAAIIAALAQDPALAHAGLAVDSLDGRVMLSGSVPTPQLRDEATQIAATVPAVAGVINEIRLAPAPSDDQRSRDAQAEAALERLMNTPDTTTYLPMRGHVFGGIAYVMAVGGSRDEDEALQTAVGSLPGINAVVAHLISTEPTQIGTATEPVTSQPLAAAPQNPQPPSPSGAMPDIPPPPEQQAMQLPPFPASGDRAQPVPSKTASPERADIARAVPPASGTRIFNVQLSSSHSEQEMRDYWTHVHAANPDILGAYTPTVAAADLGVKGTYYRLRLGPFPDAATAKSLCDALTGRKINCVVLAKPVPAAPTKG